MRCAVVALVLIAASGCGYSKTLTPDGPPTKAEAFNELQKWAAVSGAETVEKIGAKIRCRVIIDELRESGDSTRMMVRFVCSDGYVSGEAWQRPLSDGSGTKAYVTSDTLKIE